MLVDYINCLLVPPRFFLKHKVEELLHKQYVLTTKLGIQTDSNTPARNLLYWYSMYLDDKLNSVPSS